MKITTPITTKNSRFAGGADMGESHIEIHKKEHNFLMDGEPEIEVVSGGNFEDDVLNLAFKSAQKQGVKTPKEFEEYNQTLRKDRRYKDYEDYVLALSKNYWGPIEKKVSPSNSKSLKSKKRLPSDKVKTLSQNLAVIKDTKVAIDSTLLYLSNAEIYDKVLAEGGKEKLVLFRKAEAEALRIFLNSRVGKLSLPGAFREEIHYDEQGAIHAQIYSTYYQKTHVKRGKSEFDKVSWAKGKIIQKSLEEVANSFFDLELGYYALKKAHEVTNEKIKKNHGKKEGLQTNDSEFWLQYGKALVERKNGTLKVSVNAKDRANFCHDLNRLLQRGQLEAIAKEVFAKYGFEYERVGTYVTEGQEKSAKEYGKERDAKRMLNNYGAEVFQEVEEKREKIVEELAQKQEEFDFQKQNFEKEKEEKIAKELAKKKKQLEEQNEEALEKAKKQAREEEKRSFREKISSQVVMYREKFKKLSKKGFEFEDSGKPTIKNLFGWLEKAFDWVTEKMEKAELKDAEASKKLEEANKKLGEVGLKDAEATKKLKEVIYKESELANREKESAEELEAGKRELVWGQQQLEEREKKVAEREEEVDSRERKVARGEKRLARRTKETERRLEGAQSALSAFSNWQAQQLRVQAQNAQNALKNARRATYEEEEEEEDDLEF